jgi:hypothetical protein
MKISRNRRAAAAPAIYFLAVTGLLYLSFSGWAYDDPFITYRYAENLASGIGFVYNPGERILSTTTPLFTLLLAGFKPLAPSPHQLAVLVGAGSIAAGTLCLWDLSRTWKTPVAGWAALALYPTSSLLASTLSSETPLYLALCLGAFAAYARRSFLPAALLAALATLTRPDSLVLAAILLAHYIASERRLPSSKTAAAFVLPLLAWAIFAWTYFGSPIPATLDAKQGQALLQSSRGFLDGFGSILLGFSERPWFALPAALAVAGLVRLFHRRQWLLFLAWPAAYFAAFTLLEVTSYFWYYAPLLPGLVILIGLGLDGLTAWLGDRRLLGPSAGVLAAMALIVLAGAFQLADLAEMRASPDSRLPVYRAAGEWLRQNVPGNSLVGALEVGIIGYYARNPMLDFSGLIQPEVSAVFSPDSTYEDSALWAVETYRPESLVLQKGLMPRLEARLAEHLCRIDLLLPGARYGYEHDLAIYSCRP